MFLAASSDGIHLSSPGIFGRAIFSLASAYVEFDQPVEQADGIIIGENDCPGILLAETHKTLHLAGDAG